MCYTWYCKRTSQHYFSKSISKRGENMKDTYYITTPIYYASGDLHMGHCYTTVLADACARYNRLLGKDVFFLTGSDEHGLKIQRTAEAHGMTPQEFVDKTVAKFKEVWKILDISYDKFIRTTDPEHVATVQKVVQKLFDQGDIYKSSYKGLYCVPCETFFTESQLVDGKCPDCGRPVEEASEESYFFKMSKYQKFIEELIKNNPDFLVPESRKNEIYNNFIKTGVSDLCTSRSTFDWGVPLPFDPKHVVYVWIDALVNYISALGYLSDDDSLFKKYWPADVQFVGRDIARFHTVIWPILLKALDLPMPKQIHSHGFVTQKGDKISKSKGGGFDPITLANRYGTDAVRYWLLKDGPVYNDVPYTSELFIKTINSDLCNDLGNLTSRTTAMIAQNFTGVVPEPKTVVADQDSEFVDMMNTIKTKCDKAMSHQRVDDAINYIFDLVRYANKYIDMTTPWVLAKTDKDRLATVLYNLHQCLSIVAILLQAFLPQTADKLCKKLGIEHSSIENAHYSKEDFGMVVDKGEPLFVRLDVQKEVAFLDAHDPKNAQTVAPKTEVKAESKPKESEKHTASKPQITIDDFDKIELKVGKIIDSVPVENSDKLLKNTVQIGTETRTIVSGIAKYLKPCDVIGKNVVVVTNLKPIKLRGVESTGMIICAVDETNDKLSLITTANDIPSGSGVN